MRADRGIDTAGGIQFFRPNDLRVELFAHAMQPLKLKCPPQRAGKVKHSRDGMCVMRGELRNERRGGLQHEARAGEKRNIGVALTCEDRIAREAPLLAALDLAVPVSSFDEPHVELAPGSAAPLHRDT